MSAELHAYVHTPWMADASCQNKPTRWWYSTDRRDQDRAKSYCNPCPVRTECLDAAMGRDEYGIWGGMTLEERQALHNRTIKLLVCPQCKTQFARPANAPGRRLYCTYACTKRASYLRRYWDRDEATNA